MSNLHRKAVSINAGGDLTLVEAQPVPLRVRVWGVFLMAGGTVDVMFRDGETAISGPVPLTANTGFVLPVAADGSDHWMETSSGSPLILSLSEDVQVSGLLIYEVA